MAMTDHTRRKGPGLAAGRSICRGTGGLGLDSVAHRASSDAYVGCARALEDLWRRRRAVTLRRSRPALTRLVQARGRDGANVYSGIVQHILRKAPTCSRAAVRIGPRGKYARHPRGDVARVDATTPRFCSRTLRTTLRFQRMSFPSEPKSHCRCAVTRVIGWVRRLVGLMIAWGSAGDSCSPDHARRDFTPRLGGTARLGVFPLAIAIDTIGNRRLQAGNQRRGRSSSRITNFCGITSCVL